MTNQIFNEVAEKLLNNTHNTLIRKQNEYSLDEDRLSCFKRAAHIQQTTNAKALAGMLTKHVVSIYDMIASETAPTEAMALEKCGDAINYLVLLYAIWMEEGFKNG